MNEYNQLMTDIIRKGFDTGFTHALLNRTVDFDLSICNSENGYIMYCPFNRGTYESNLNYAIAEAIWYLRATREIDMIAPFGPIWKKMVDKNNLVNSNYGYQIKYNNLNFQQHIENLRQNGTCDFYIASRSNMTSQNDLVCNNKITLHFDGINLSATVVARSIDVVMGLPYDMFAAQGFMMMIAKHLGQHIKLNRLTFWIANVHMYNEHQPNEQSIKSLSNKVLTIPFDLTPFNHIEKSKAISAIEEVKIWRKEISSHSKIIEYENNDFKPMVIYPDTHMTFYSLSDLQLMISSSRSGLMRRYDEIALNHFMKVLIRLVRNKFERKTLVMSPKRDLSYIMFDGERYHLTNFIGDK